MSQPRILLIVILTLWGLFETDTLIAQTLHGVVTDADGSPLAYTTIYLTNEKSGTASNEEGTYQISLSEGQHQVVFQYLGYQTEKRTVTVGRSNLRLDVVMKEEVTTLSTIKVTSKDEDPAYRIMRQAIAKAKFHTQQLDFYQTEVYIKGAGRLKKLPWLLRRRIEREMKKEGIDTATAFVSESVSQITYHRPDQYEERVISIRKVGEDNNTSPAEFIQTSFYAPEVNGAVSPLSPKAFAYYSFEYLGFIADRGYNVNKIKVTPRSRGDQVFEGVIYIVDDLWSIHSLDLFTYLWGIKFQINLIYAPIQDNVWLPVNQLYDVTGSVFGFGFEYRYLANMSDYQIEINPDLTFQPKLLDEKLESEAAKKAEANLKDMETDEFFQAIEAGEEISQKQLRKALRTYEKQELKESRTDTLEDVMAIRNQEIDSLAYERDSIYWTKIRPIPLTQYEVRGYRAMDSMAIVYAKEEEQAASDSLAVTLSADGVTSTSSLKSKFKLVDLLLGGARFKVRDGLHFGYPGVLLNTHFNTVEGYHISWKPYFLGSGGSLRWRLEGVGKYAFARDRFLPSANVSLSWGEKSHETTIHLNGGISVDQINPDKPIDPLINDLSSLLFERNFLKVLQREGVELKVRRRLGPAILFEGFANHFQYHSLSNHTAHVIFGSDQRSYTSNAPFNLEYGNTEFASFKMQSFGTEFEVRPKSKYRLVNGRKTEITRNLPTVGIHYSWNLLPEGDRNESFQHFEVHYLQKAKIGIRGDLGIDLRLGTYTNREKIPFPAFKHFPGNRTFVHITDPLGSFRLMPYYEYSTSKTYLEAHASYQFRKFLLTQVPFARLAGIRENLFVNWLSAGAIRYLEVGFGINYIFRFLRLEFVTAYDDFQYREFGIRLGLASNLDALFD